MIATSITMTAAMKPNPSVATIGVYARVNAMLQFKQN
jgi:hypothetical protein